MAIEGGLDLRQTRAFRARAVSWLISGTCVVGFLLWARHQRVPRLPSGMAESLALLLGVVAYAVATFGLCERWSFLLRRQTPCLSRFVGYRPALLGQLGNVFLPARAGDALRVGLVAATHEEISMRTAVGTLVAERALDISCQAVLLVVVLAGMFGWPVGELGRIPTILLGLALLAGAISALHVVGSSVSSRLGIGQRAPRLWGPLLAPLVGLRHGGRAAVLLSVVMWVSEIGGWWAASHAVGLNLSVLQAAYVFAIASLALIVPVGFGAIGTLDAGILFSVKTIGVGTAPVLSFVLLLRVLFVLPSLVAVVGIALERHMGRLGHAIVTRRGPS
jgi:uncharacterized membrane protein YbhN (UPF0104 family)